MDISKLIYSDIGENILDRFFNEGKEIVQPGSFEDYLKLPLTEFKSEEKEIKKEPQKGYYEKK